MRRRIARVLRWLAHKISPARHTTVVVQLDSAPLIARIDEIALALARHQRAALNRQ